MKKQSLAKGKPGPIKVKVHKTDAVRVLVGKGLIYMHIVSGTTTIHANYTVMVLGKFRKNFKMKRPEMLNHEEFFY